jgi:hypothetical protein
MRDGRFNAKKNSTLTGFNGCVINQIYETLLFVVPKSFLMEKEIKTFRS